MSRPTPPPGLLQRLTRLIPVVRSRLSADIVEAEVVAETVESAAAEVDQVLRQADAVVDPSANPAPAPEAKPQ